VRGGADGGGACVVDGCTPRALPSCKGGRAAQVAAEHAVVQTAAVVRVLLTEARRECCRAAMKAVAVQTAAARVVVTEAYREGC